MAQNKMVKTEAAAELEARMILAYVRLTGSYDGASGVLKSVGAGLAFAEYRGWLVARTDLVASTDKNGRAITKRVKVVGVTAAGAAAANEVADLDAADMPPAPPAPPPSKAAVAKAAKAGLLTARELTDLVRAAADGEPVAGADAPPVAADLLAHLEAIKIAELRQLVKDVPALGKVPGNSKALIAAGIVKVIETLRSPAPAAPAPGAANEVAPAADAAPDAPADGPTADQIAALMLDKMKDQPIADLRGLAELLGLPKGGNRLQVAGRIGQHLQDSVQAGTPVFPAATVEGIKAMYAQMGLPVPAGL